MRRAGAAGKAPHADPPLLALSSSGEEHSARRTPTQTPEEYEDRINRQEKVLRALFEIAVQTKSNKGCIFGEVTMATLDYFRGEISRMFQVPRSVHEERKQKREERGGQMGQGCPIGTPGTPGAEEAAGILPAANSAPLCPPV